MTGARPSIAGIVLAGGEGRRIGVDKALVPLAGRPLVLHAIARLRPQVDALWLSVRDARGELDRLGYPVARDASPEAAGPIAGIAAGLAAAGRAGHELAVVVPCDAPFLPTDLVARLVGALGDAPAVVVAGERLHPTFGLWRTSLAPSLAVHVAAGGRRLASLCDAIGVARLATPPEWPPHALLNVNTPADRDLADEMCRALDA